MRYYYNFVLMIFWLAVLYIVLDPLEVVPDKLRKQFGGPLQLPVAILASLLAAYNGVRWWAYRSLRRNRPARTVNPLAVRKVEPDGDREEEPNPEFDFSNTPHPPPGPSINGDHK
jgi:hypothetical protein